MAKRTADHQISKDDQYESDDERDRNEPDPGNRETPLAPVAGRVIKGLPKRKGMGSSTPATSSPAPPAASTSAPSFNFNFGGSSTPSSGGFSLGTSSSTPATSAPPKTSPFAGFSFGKPAATSTTTSTTSSNAQAPFAFGSSTATVPTFGGSSGTPSTSTSTPVTKETQNTAPPVKKPFAGFSFGASTQSTSNPPTTSKAPEMNGSSSNFSQFGSGAAPSASTTTAPAPAAVSSTSSTSTSSSRPTPSQANPPPESETTYFASIRGLNNSILTFLNHALQKDPFQDLSRILPGLQTEYQKHLGEAVKKAGWQPEKAKQPQSSATNGIVEPAKSGLSLPKPPAPPAVGSFTLLKPSNSTTTTPASGGFKPTLPTTSGASSNSPFSFSFGAKPAPETKRPSAETNKLAEEILNAPEKTEPEPPKTSAFSFGSASTPAAKPSSTNLFNPPGAMHVIQPQGPLQSATPDSKTFTPSSSLENPSPAKLGKFGPGGSTPQLSFGGAKTFAPSTPATPGNAKPFSFGFGSGSGTATATSPSAAFSFGSSGTTAGAGTSSASSSSQPAFVFGPSSTTPAPPFPFPAASSSTVPSRTAAPTSAFSFGTPAPSTAASTSAFSFGAPAKPTSTPAPSFSFGGPSTSTATSGFATPTEPAATEEVAEGEVSKNLAESAGAGEEDEETVVEQRAKLFKFDKESNKQELQGLGVFKVKKGKKGDDGKSKRRLLMRTDGGGNIVLNMLLTTSFNPSSEGPTVKFVGFDVKGQPAPFTLRVKTADVASQLVEKLKSEVEALKE